MARCDDCRYALREWAGRRCPCYIRGCEKDGDMSAEDCDMWEEREDE